MLNEPAFPADDPGLAATEVPEVRPTVREGADARRVRLVQGSGPALSTETQRVLGTRLRIAALVLCLGLLVLLGWNVVNLTMTPFNIRLLVLLTLVVVLVAGIGAWLTRHAALSSTMLRVHELLIFGLPAAFFLYWQYGYVTSYVEYHNVLPEVTPVWLILVFVYALFIPNSMIRATIVVGVLCLAPVALTMALMLLDVACRQANNATWSFFWQELLTMLVAATIAIVGVRTIGNLRREAFEAKQLGQYRLGSLLGQGGMGEVYLAQHQMMKRPCAIKLIRPEKASDPQMLARFEREVHATAQLSHWNSVEIYDYGRADDGTFYYVMEYLPGGNLNDLVRKHGPLSAARAVHLLRQTCEALAEAHQAGLVHRDIKPHNLFAACRGGVHDVAKLLDFGLVKPLADHDELDGSHPHGITGSPLYLSPEQATGQLAADLRSDIYSLGAVGYYLLTGRPPFVEQNTVQLLLAHARQEVVPPSRWRAGIPADVDQILVRCLQKDPGQRYQSAAELAAALDACSVAGRWTNADARHWWRSVDERGTGAAD